MFANRFQSWKVATPKVPKAAQPAPLIPYGFAVAPPNLAQPPASWQAQLFQAAYEQALQAAQPAHYRRFFSVWN